MSGTTPANGYSDPQEQQATPGATLANGYSALSAGDSFTCGLRASGEIECWGISGSKSSPPAGAFRAVSAGDDHACGPARRRTDRVLGKQQVRANQRPTGQLPRRERRR